MSTSYTFFSSVLHNQFLCQQVCFVNSRMSLSPASFSKWNSSLQYIPKLQQQYLKLFNWKKNLKIVDIGTGPGHVLMGIKPSFPKDYAEIVCTDMLQQMVDHFNSLKKDPRITCVQMDIQTTTLPNTMKNRFDFAFSCNCIMYLSNIRQSFLNISQLLNQSGELLFIWPKRCDVHDCYKEICKIDKWSAYASDFKNWQNYFDTDNPTGTVEMELQRVGIKILKMEHFDVTLQDQGEIKLIDMFDALDYLSCRIPKCDLPQYMEDYRKIVRDRLIVDPNADNGTKYKLPFPSLIVAGRKN